MTISSILFRIAVGIAVAQTTAVPAPPPPDAVLVTYADGLRTSIIVGPTRCGMWTPAFPRVTPWTPPPDQLPVSAINFVCQRASEGIQVAVSVFRGSPHQQEDPIATVLVTPTQPVVIDQLRTVGVNALTLSLGHVTKAAVPTPAVGTASPLLEVAAISVTAAPRPMYQFLLRNRAPRAVRTLFIEAARNGRLALSGRRTGREGSPLIAIAGDFWFDQVVPTARPLADGSVALAPVDSIYVSAIVWADGSHDGGVGGPNALVSDYGDRLQLTRLVTELQRARPAGADVKPADLRAAILAMPTEPTDAMVDDARASVPAAAAPDYPRNQVVSLLRVSLSAIKRMAIDDLGRFESGPASAGAFEAWLNTASERYLRWIERLGSQFRR